MTKLEELRAAYAAEPWGLSDADADMMETRLVHFYNAAHNLMPQLLEAVNHLAECQELLRDYPWVYQECKRILEKLK